ncbi:MAG TPA: hypothetical protein VGH49_07895 [Xanthobacteraceae bacterium]|jgi:hypothetical protein
MTVKLLVAATTAAVLAGASPASAHLPAPLVPTALVEDVKSAAAGVEFMDYVGFGQVIRLAAGDVLVLSYLKSCEHETITGGTVAVGAERSDVEGGQVVRTKVPCGAGQMRLSAEQASQSAASAFRVQSADIQPSAGPPMLYGRKPLVQFPKALAADDRTLLIERTDRPGERHELRIDNAIAAAGFYDLAKSNVTLTRGASYDARIGGYKVAFRIAAKAKSGAAPVISRLVRFQ